MSGGADGAGGVRGGLPIDLPDLGAIQSMTKDPKVAATLALLVNLGDGDYDV